jgi:hypothetical protein
VDPHHPALPGGVVVPLDDGYLAGEDDVEVAFPLALPDEHIAGPDRALLATLGQQLDVPLGQRGIGPGHVRCLDEPLAFHASLRRASSTHLRSIGAGAAPARREMT